MTGQLIGLTSGDVTIFLKSASKINFLIQILRDKTVKHFQSLLTVNIITDRVRSTTVRYCFHRCLSVHRGRGSTSARSQPGGEGVIKVPTPWPDPVSNHF